MRLHSNIQSRILSLSSIMYSCYRYWTDNGACYYYTTGSNYSNYEDLIVAVKKDADQSGLPFQYVQVC